MLQRSADTTEKDKQKGLQENNPEINLEFIPRGVLRKKIYNKQSLSIQFVRIAVILFPRPIEIFRENQLPKKTSKTIKNLRYNTSPTIDEEATYKAIRNKYLLYNQSVVNSKAIHERNITAYLTQLIENNVKIHIINSPEENVFLIIGVEYSSKLMIHPQSDVRSQIINRLISQHYILDQYPNLKGMSNLIKINRDFHISFFQSTQSHPQMQTMDRTIIYNLIESMTKLSKIDGVNHDYDIEGFTAADFDTIKKISGYTFYLHLEDEELLQYKQIVGTSLALIAGQDNFQTWLLHYSFYLEYTKSVEIKEMDTSIVVIGGPKPLGYAELQPEELRLDLLEIVRNNPYNVWMPVFRLIGGLFSFSARLDVAARFAQAWSDIKNALMELLSQVDSFEKLIEKLQESFENALDLTDDGTARDLLSIFNQIRIKDVFNRAVENDDLFNLPKRLFIPTTNYSEKDILLLLYILSLRADLDDEPIDSIIINDNEVSALMASDKIRMILDDKNTGYDDIRKVHRITRMKQTRFNTIPKIILSYNHEVKQYLNKEWYHKNETWKVKFPLFEKSCLLIPDQPPRRIFTSETDEEFVNFIIGYEKLDQSSFEEIPSIEEEVVEPIVTATQSIDQQEEIDEKEIEPELETIIAESNEDTDKEVVEEEKTEEQPIVEAPSTESVDKIPELIIPKRSIKEDQPVANQTLSQPTEINTEDTNKIEESNLHNSDKALKHYNEIFDIDVTYSKLLNNKPTITPEVIFNQIDKLANNLENLYDFYMDKNISLSLEEVKARNLAQLEEKKLIEILPGGSTGYLISLTNAGTKIIDDTFKELNEINTELKDKGIDIQNIMINSSTIMENFRQQGKIRNEVALFNWAQLLTIAYYHKFSKLTPLAYSINQKIISILESGKWIKDHDNFIKSFIERYQNKLFVIDQEILMHEVQKIDPSLTADMKRMPIINVIKPSDPKSEEQEITGDNEEESEVLEGIVTDLKEFDEFDLDKNVIENTSGKEKITITTFDKEEEKKIETRPRRTKAAKERASRNLLKLQKEKFQEELQSNEYQSEFDELEESTRNEQIEKRMKARINSIGNDFDKNLYFYQPSWNMSVDESMHKFDVMELPLSLFNFKNKTKKMLVGCLDQPVVGELMKIKMDWTKLPSVGKKSHEEITDFQLLFDNWSDLKGDQIFNLMSRDGLKHLFEQKIYFEPIKLPENILLPLHEDLKKRYNKQISSIINEFDGNTDSSDISRKIIDTIYLDLCNVLEIESEENYTEARIHKINQFQHNNHKMSRNEKDPIFDLTWVLKFGNYENEGDGRDINEFREKLSTDLDQLMISYQVQNKLLELSKIDKTSNKKKSKNKSNKGRELA